MQGTTLFDVLSAIGLTGSAAIVAVVLSWTLAKNVRGRHWVALLAAAWFLTVVAFGVTGALNAQFGAGVAGLAAAVVVPIAALCFVLLVYKPTREAMSDTPLWVLVAVNTLRVLGVSFVLLYSADRLPAPFAPAAGWGDVFVGLTAGPLAWILVRHGVRTRAWVLAWNLIGFVDLIAAIGLGATSAPGLIRMFMDPPGTAIMTTLPWIIIPCFLVPIFEALHIAIFYRLYASRARSPTHDVGSVMPPAAPA
jgi:hypothetical protein